MTKPNNFKVGVIFLDDGIHFFNESERLKILLHLVWYELLTYPVQGIEANAADNFFSMKDKFLKYCTAKDPWKYDASV